jgi:uncharacterized protein YeaO (DUF488 family)
VPEDGGVEATHEVRVARVYDRPAAGDGARVLVDRLWPRGLAARAAALDDWCKQVAPSNELRSWYGHDPERFDEFSARYLDELRDPDRAAALDGLRKLARRRDVILLTATRALEISHAAVLARVLSAPG